MNLNIKKDELVRMLVGFLEGRVSANELCAFSWEVIDFFTRTPLGELPVERPDERPFWYAIWQIQHLSDDLHQRDGVATRELSKALLYLRGSEDMPEQYAGRRPK